MTAAVAPALSPAIAPRRLARALGGLKTLALGTLLTATPVTSLIALGWLSRATGGRIRRLWGMPADPPGWLLGPPGSGHLARLAGGLAHNIRAGFGTLAGLALITLPFTGLWALAWWAGWQNSFTKGYEQAQVGPLLFLAATALALPLMALLPFALAHAAAEERWAATTELRRIRSVARASGWRLAWTALLTLAAALPLFAYRGLPAFAGDLLPGLDRMTPDEIAALKGRIALAGAFWAFLSLIVLRRAAATAYAIAAPRAAAALPPVWEGARAAVVPAAARRGHAFPAALWMLIAMAANAGLVLLIVVGQFLNHAWWMWLTHPYLLLPWPG
jgi:hypothetical protein